MTVLQHPASTEQPAEPAADTPAPTPAAFVQRHQRGLWRFLRALGCPASTADDLAQEALLVALRGDGWRRPPLAAAAFLRQTARHLWLRHRRDEGRRAERLAAAAEHLWQRHCENDDGDARLAALRACVQALPERSRTTLDHFYRDGMSRAELAAALAMTEHGARTLLQRIRAALRECIERRTQA